MYQNHSFCDQIKFNPRDSHRALLSAFNNPVFLKLCHRINITSPCRVFTTSRTRSYHTRTLLSLDTVQAHLWARLQFWSPKTQPVFWPLCSQSPGNQSQLEVNSTSHTHWRINSPSPGPSPTAILPSSKALCWGSSPAPEKPEAQTRSTCPALDTPASTTHTWGARRTELSRSGHDCHWINPQSLLCQPHSVTCKCMLLTEGGWSPLKHTGPSTCKWGLVHLWTPSVWGSSCGGDRQ